MFLLLFKAYSLGMIFMYGDENYIKITKIKDNESIEIHQEYVRLRESKNSKLMAFNVKAPLFETAEIERFFEGFNSSDKLKVNIGGTGSFGVNFRGLLEGKEKNFSQNIDHIIILLEEFYCPSKEDLKNVKRVSKFMPRGYFN